ncbi:hypothetical protein GX441_06735 [bacterium]|nr:hypothetical protein [bacterium]
MLKKGWMVLCAAAVIVIIALSACEPAVPDWEQRDSYIMVTDTSSNIFIIDDAGDLIATVLPLKDSMTGIRIPCFVDASKGIAFLSQEKPDYPFTLYVTDRSAKKLTHFDGLVPFHMDGSPAEPYLIYTTSASSSRIWIMRTDDPDAESNYLFSGLKAYCKAIDDSVTIKEVYRPGFSPDGDKVAFVTLGKYTTVDNEGKIISLVRTDIGVADTGGSGYYLATGGLKDEESLPLFSQWLDVCWSYDGRWIFAVKGNASIEEVYAFDTQTDSLYFVDAEYLGSYYYFCPSPLDSTIALGTNVTRHADVYMTYFTNDHALAYSVSSRLSNKGYYFQPDWAPGGE